MTALLLAIALTVGCRAALPQVAATRGHAAVVRILIANKARAEIPNGSIPPINAAIQSSNYDTVVAIVEAGADLKTAKPKKTEGVWPKPLEVARTRKLTAIEQYLVSKGAE